MEEQKAQEIYHHIKKAGWNKPFDEARHCVMMLKAKGRMSEFCVEALVSSTVVFKWLKASELFQECYALARMFDKLEWEKEGLQVRDEILGHNERSNRLDHWKMIGWERFGIGKTSRIRLDLDPNATPDKHYAELIAQASKGDFTAGEIKQLMEAINVGLSTHQVIKLQKEIEQLRDDLAIMDKNTHGDNTSAVTRST